jgi:hypothetical protein
VACSIPKATPVINQYSPPGQFDPYPTKKKKRKKLDKKQGTEKDMQQRRQGVLSIPEKWGGPRS